jgi:hypothetical protein
MPGMEAEYQLFTLLASIAVIAAVAWVVEWIWRRKTK